MAPRRPAHLCLLIVIVADRRVPRGPQVMGWRNGAYSSGAGRLIGNLLVALISIPIPAVAGITRGVVDLSGRRAALTRRCGQTCRLDCASALRRSGNCGRVERLLLRCRSQSLGSV
jgi:hypothetical protein